MEVSSRCVWFGVAIPSALPRLVCGYLEIMDGVVPTFEPSNIDANVINRRWILLRVHLEFENARRDRIWPELPITD